MCSLFPPDENLLVTVLSLSSCPPYCAEAQFLSSMFPLTNKKRGGDSISFLSFSDLQKQLCYEILTVV